MAVQLRVAAGGSNAATGPSVAIPASVQTDDLMVVVADINNTATTMTPAAGWTQIQTSAGDPNGGSQYAAMFTRRAVAGDAGSTVTFPVTPTGATKAATFAAFYSDAINTLVSIGVSAYRAETTVGTTHVTPTINVTALPALLLAAIGKKGTTVTTITQPTGYTIVGTPNITAGSSNNATALATAAAGSTGNTSATWTTDVSNQAATTFLASLVEGAPPPPPAMPYPVFRRWNGQAWVAA